MNFVVLIDVHFLRAHALLCYQFLTKICGSLYIYLYIVVAQVSKILVLYRMFIYLFIFFIFPHLLVIRP